MKEGLQVNGLFLALKANFIGNIYHCQVRLSL